jgi:hypothetical protein
MGTVLTIAVPESKLGMGVISIDRDWIDMSSQST